MLALDKVSFLLFVCAGCVVQAGAESTEGSNVFRHRYHKFQELYQRILKLDNIIPKEMDEEKFNYLMLYKPNTQRPIVQQEISTESFKSVDVKSDKQLEQEEDLPLEEDDSDYDEFSGSEIMDDFDTDQKDQRMYEEMIKSDSDNETTTFEPDMENGSQADAGLDSGVKWIYFGNREQLERSRGRITRYKQEDINKALMHALNMSNEGMCKIPQRRVIPIQHIYPNPSKTYVPHCTFLHRCGDDIGCCGTDSLTCVPKSNETVELFFYTTVVGSSRKIVEKLSFINYTECECVPRKIDFMIKDETIFSLTRSGPTFHGVLDIPEVKTEAPTPLKRCQCPSEYSVRITNGDCECDCFNRHRDCMRIKRGKEYFGLKDRRCIQSGQCETPICEFGEYIHKTGRCPKRADKFDEMSRHTRLFRNV